MYAWAAIAGDLGVFQEKLRDSADRRLGFTRFRRDREAKPMVPGKLNFRIAVPVFPKYLIKPYNQIRTGRQIESGGDPGTNFRPVQGANVLPVMGQTIARVPEISRFIFPHPKSFIRVNFRQPRHIPARNDTIAATGHERAILVAEPEGKNVAWLAGQRIA